MNKIPPELILNQKYDIPANSQNILKFSDKNNDKSYREGHA